MQPLGVLLSLVFIVIASLLLGGLFTVQPNEAKVLTLFGRAGSSVKQDGFHWANPS